MDSVRLDSWLNAARIFKTRSLAAKAVRGGKVKVGGESVRPSRPIRLGDRISITIPRYRRELEVLDLEAKRQSPARARELYLEHEEDIPPEDKKLMDVLRKAGPRRERGTGRPTKRERRLIEKFRGGD
jgi:ribosome-associated heat shock protein Hsp15